MAWSLVGRPQFREIHSDSESLSGLKAIADSPNLSTTNFTIAYVLRTVRGMSGSTLR